MRGFNINLLNIVKNADMPIIISGGMSSADELIVAEPKWRASAVLGGSCFIFSDLQSCAINYPKWWWL